MPFGGSYVQFRVKDGDDFRPGLYELHRLRRVLLFVSGDLVLVAIALVCVGPMGGLRSFWHGYGQVVRGGFALVMVGEPLVRSLFGLVRVSPAWAILGIVAAKMAAFNLLPLPPLTGGQILWNLVDWRGPLADRFHVVLAWVGIVTTLILYFGWLYAIVQVLIEG